jgi:phosphopentomutase
VFQIACHEDLVPIEELYEMCKKARSILVPPHNVSRVIARPFVGRPGSFVRTERRRDFSLIPSGRTLLDAVTESGGGVLAIGKTEDLFANRGITRAKHTLTDAAGMRALACAAAEPEEKLIFANVVDLDMLYGHRNNVQGYARGLEAIDQAIGPVLQLLTDKDAFIVTADHGNDPATPSTDHSREYVPVLAYRPGLRGGVDLGVRASFADVAATAAELLGIEFECPGTSFASLLH